MSETSDNTTQTFADIYIDEPITNGLIMRWEGDRAATNVPHFVTLHSPNGFAFGYAGSGPADLALNAVEAILRANHYEGELSELLIDGAQCFLAAWHLHQDFKWIFVTSAPDEGATVPFAIMNEWINVHLRTLDEAT